MTGERAPSRPESVFQRLLQDIMDGGYAPGQSLPSERALSEQLSVSRSVLREALKRLSQLGLITTQHGGSSRTNDWRRTAGLDLLAVLAGEPRTDASKSCWVSLLEMRAAIAADAARLCALRADPALRQELLVLAQKMARGDEPEELFHLEVRFWGIVIDGAENIAYRLAFNTIMRAVPKRASAAHQLAMVELQRSRFRLPLAEAIARGDGEAAEAEARTSLRRSADSLRRALQRLDNGARGAPSDDAEHAASGRGAGFTQVADAEGA